MNYFVGASVSYWFVLICAMIEATYSSWAKEGYLPVIAIYAFFVNYLFCLIGLLLDKLLVKVSLNIKVTAFVLLGYISGVLLHLLFEQRLDLLPPGAILTIPGAVLYVVSSNVVSPIRLKYLISYSAPLVALCSFIYLVLES